MIGRQISWIHSASYSGYREQSGTSVGIATDLRLETRLNCEDLNIQHSAYVQSTVSKHREYTTAFIISEIQRFSSKADIHKQNKIFFSRFCSIMQHSETVPTRPISEAFLAKDAYTEDQYNTTGLSVEDKPNKNVYTGT